MEWLPLDAAPRLNPIADFRLTRPDTMHATPTAKAWWSVLIDIRNSTLNGFVQKIAAAFPGQMPTIILPDVFSAAERDVFREQRIVPIFARAAVVQAMNARPNPFDVAALEIGAVFTDDDIMPGLPQGTLLQDINVPEGTVVMAVIDDGIAIAHELFCDDALRSRIDLAYVMAGNEAAFVRHTQGHSLDRPVIDRLLKDHTCNGLLDEDAFYRAAGMLDFSKKGFSPTCLARSHGTHVTSLAAGFGAEELNDSRPIICAMLPPQVTWDVTGQTLAPSLALALEVLLSQASRYRLPNGSLAPVVFNFSYGTFTGPHDGTGLIAQMLEYYFAQTGGQKRRIVLPAGNGNLARAHARLQFAADEAKHKVLQLSLPPDDGTANFVQFWMPYSADLPPPVDVRFRVKPPGGPESPLFDATEGAGVKLVDGAGHEIARLTYDFHPWPTCRGAITLALHPTASIDCAAALAPAGSWRITISKLDLATDQSVQVWVSREETRPGFPPFGRQAHFDDAGYQMFDAIGAPLAVDPAGSDCPVRRAGMLNEFATGPTPIVIAGLTASSGELSDYSSAGPITPLRGGLASRSGPDAAATSDDSPVLVGVIGAGSRRGSFVRQSGTSVAAPLVARYLATGIQAGHPADRTWIANEAAKQDKTYPAPKLPKTRAGSGRLRLKARVGSMPGQK